MPFNDRAALQHVAPLLLGFLLFVLSAYFALKLAPAWFAPTKLDGHALDVKTQVDARQGVTTAAVTLLAGVVALGGLFYTARSFILSRTGQLTDRFMHAVEQLGNKRFKRAYWRPLLA